MVAPRGRVGIPTQVQKIWPWMQFKNEKGPPHGLPVVEGKPKLYSHAEVLPVLKDPLHAGIARRLRVSEEPVPVHCHPRFMQGEIMRRHGITASRARRLFERPDSRGLGRS